jgi:hypothetical protein
MVVFTRNRQVHYLEGRTSTRSDVERHPSMLSNKQDFFVLADTEYFENYAKYVKLFDEIFMRRG